VALTCGEFAAAFQAGKPLGVFPTLADFPATLPLIYGKRFPGDLCDLLATTVATRSHPQLALTVLPKALASSRVLKGARGEASDAVDAIPGSLS